VEPDGPTWLRLRGTRLGARGRGALGCWTGFPGTGAGGAGSVGPGVPRWAAGAEQHVAAPLVCLAEGLGWRLPGVPSPAVGCGASRGTGTEDRAGEMARISDSHQRFRLDAVNHPDGNRSLVVQAGGRGCQGLGEEARRGQRPGGPPSQDAGRVWDPLATARSWGQGVGPSAWPCRNGCSGLRCRCPVPS